jgi:hypothetical protein
VLPALHEISNVRSTFTATLEREALKHTMFNARGLSDEERKRVVHFQGNALVNAVGRLPEDFIHNSTLLELPGFARLPREERIQLVTEWLDEHGLDTQYELGTIENAMATVLKTAALKGGVTGKPYGSEQELAIRFMRAANSWSDKGGSVLDPRVLLGLNLARTQGVAIEGDSVSEKLANLQQYMRDVFTEVRTPPRFDRRQTALDILKRKTGLSEAQLTVGGKPGESILDIFLSKVGAGFFDYSTIAKDDGPSFEPHALMTEAETAFNDALPTHEWILARARMELRRAREPISDESLKAKCADIAKRCVTALERETAGLLHWAENMPIVGLFMGLGEGIVERDLTKIVSAIPVVGNVYNTGAGIINRDGQRVANATLTLIPVVGSVYNIEEGVRTGDGARATGGVVGLGLDIATLGEGHAAIVSRYAGARTLGEAAEHSSPAEYFSTAEVPLPLAGQAAHTLGALGQLGIEHLELAATPTERRLAANYSVPKPAGITVETVGEAPLPVEDGARYINLGPDWYKVRKDTSNGTWRIVRPDDSATAYQPPVRFADGRWVEHADTGLPGGAPSGPIEAAVRRATEYAEQHEDAMLPAEALEKNARGQLQRTDYKVLFRGETRSPTSIIRSGGFGVSHIFVNERLTEFPPLITSARYEGARTFIVPMAGMDNEYYYIYVLKSEGREAASLNENARYNPQGLADLINVDVEDFEDPEDGVDVHYALAYDFDEVHVRGGFSNDEIYLLDTDDPQWLETLQKYHAGQPNVLGLPLSDIPLEQAAA